MEPTAPTRRNTPSSSRSSRQPHIQDPSRLVHGDGLLIEVGIQGHVDAEATGVGPVVLAARDRAPWPVVGLATGGLAGLPLALLALATACPLTVQLGSMGAAGIEGLLLARLVVSGTSHSGGDQQRGP